MVFAVVQALCKFGKDNFYSLQKLVYDLPQSKVSARNPFPWGRTTKLHFAIRLSWGLCPQQSAADAKIVEGNEAKADSGRQNGASHTSKKPLRQSPKILIFSCDSPPSRPLWVREPTHAEIGHGYDVCYRDGGPSWRRVRAIAWSLWAQLTL